MSTLLTILRIILIFCVLGYLIFKDIKIILILKINCQFIKTLESRVHNYFEMLINTNERYMDKNVSVSKLQYHQDHFQQNHISRIFNVLKLSYNAG
jgi:hypothetical protein